MRLAQVRAWQSGPAAARPHVAAAARHANRLPDRERTLLSAFRLFANADMAALDTMLAYVGHYPADPDAWFLLGEIQYHGRHQLALEPERIYRSFERVLELDSSIIPAIIHLVELSVETGDTARLNSYLRTMGGRVPPNLVAPFRTAREFMTSTPDSAVGILADYMLNMPDSTDYDYRKLLGFLVAATFHLESLAPGIAVAAFDRAFAALDPAGPRYGKLYPLYKMTALGAGQIAEARAPASVKTNPSPFSAAFPYSTPVVFGYPPALGTTGAGDRSASMDTYGPADTITAVIHAYTALARGNAAEARTLIRRVRRTSNASGKVHALATALAGWERLAGGDTASGIQMINQGLSTVNKAENVFARVRFERAAALAARPETREEGLRELRNGFGSTYPMIPMMYLRIGRIREAMGDWKAAIRAYEQVLRIWSEAGPTLTPRIESVRRSLEKVRANAALR